MYLDPPEAKQPERFFKNDPLYFKALGEKEMHTLHRDETTIKSDNPWKGFSQVVAS